MRRIFGIDMSIKATGLCVLDDDSTPDPTVLETIPIDENDVGMDHIAKVLRRVVDVIDTHKPDLIAMEDYAISGGMGTNNLTRLCEVGGIIKWYCHDRGYKMGYGTPKNEKQRIYSHHATRHADKIFVAQPSTTMKKFCLGRGDIKKDSRYIATVQEAMMRKFEDDNQADAYMHAWMAGIVIAVLRGRAKFDDLPMHQQDSMMGTYANLPKGMSKTKALKLPLADKMVLLEI